MFNKIRIVFSLLLVSGYAFSQTATIRGFVYDKESGEPVIFTNVYLQSTNYGAATDVNGFYTISKVPEGSYTLTVTYLGYDTLKENISVKSNQILSKQLYLSKANVNLKTFEVSAEKQEAMTEVKMSVVKITPKDIKSIPAIGGEADIAQYLQVLPGVIFTGDQGGQLYIRGGSPIQNKVLLDGMTIYNPFHTIGFFSVFETDILRNADVYTGGFNAEYGGRISSIMNITTRDGNKKRYSGKIGANTFGAKAIIEGPIKRAKEAGDGSISFIATVKESYLDRSSKLLYSYIDKEGLPFTFRDYYGKVSFTGGNGSKVNVFGFNFNDRVNWQAVSNLNWNNIGGTNFVLIPGTSPVLVEGNFSYSKYEISLAESERQPRTSGIEGFNLGLDFTYFLADNELKYGVQVEGFGTTFNFYNSLNRKITQDENTTQLSGYLKYKWVIGKLVAEPSFRAMYYASLNNFSPEPRLGLKYNIVDKFRLKAATGIYSQNLISGNSDRDVVNLFYGFLSGPDNLQKTFTDEDGNKRDVAHNLQKANHFIFGFEYDITSRFGANVETYYKRFTQLTNLNRNKIYDDSDDNFSKPDILKKDFIIETGDAYGIDFTFKYEFKRVYLWAVYSLAKNTRWDGIITYNPVFDRRHNVNLLGTYNFGKDLDWEVSLRWNLGSGFPFTQTQGYYEKFTFSDGIDTDYTTENGQLGIYYAPLNQGRLPYYHRLDFNLKKNFVISENSIIEANFSITNAYNRENIFYFDRVKFERVNQLPFLPSLGATWTF
jgi:hypothetical protein